MIDVKTIGEMAVKAEGPKIIEIGEHTYTDANLSRIREPEENGPAVIALTTLSSLAMMAETLAKSSDLIAHVVSPFHVNLLEKAMTVDNVRHCLAKAETPGTEFRFGNWMELEEFCINLKSQFVQDENLLSLVNTCSIVASEDVRTNKDDGMSQTVQVRSGILTKAEQTINNPIVLHPFRTFMEVEQPGSECLFRFKKSDRGLLAALFTADGQRWMIEATASIAKWLTIEAHEDLTIIA